MSRGPVILANAAFYILTWPSAVRTGSGIIDEEVMMQEGNTDVSHDNVLPGANLFRDLFVD
jgi:citronellol/citronellal dehydrogenase